jgi:hypothetical protein
MNRRMVEIKIKTLSNISIMYLGYKMIMINIIYHITQKRINI